MRKTIIAAATAGAGLIAAVIATAATGHAPAPSPAATAAGHAAASATLPAPPSPRPPRVRIRFAVTGTGTPSIIYGTDNDNRTPPGSAGPLGDGVPLPFHGSIRFRPGTQFYSITAQLEGGGNIRCCIIADAGPGYRPLVISAGHASGGYNICSAQAAPGGTDPATGLPTWMDEG